MKYLQRIFVTTLPLCLLFQVSLSAMDLQPVLISAENAAQIEPHITIRADALEFITDAVISHDDSLIVLRGANLSSPLQLWDVETRSLHAILTPAQSEPIWEIVFSPNDTAIATRQDNLIQVWSADDAATLLTIENLIGPMQFLPADNMLAYTTLYWEGSNILPSDSIHFWNYAEGREVFQLEHPGVISFDVDSSGRYLVSGSIYGSVRLWEIDLTAGEYSYQLLQEDSGYRVKGVENVGFTDGGELLFFSIWNSEQYPPYRSLHLWNYRTNEAREPLHHTDIQPGLWMGGTLFLTWFPDDNSYDLWDASSNTSLLRRTASINTLNHDYSVGLRYVGTGRDLELISIETGDVLKSISMTCQYACVAAFSPGGRYLLIRGEGNFVTL